MHSIKLAVSIAAIAACLGVCVAPAFADQIADAKSCLSLERQAKSALETGEKSTNYDDALRQVQDARSFCMNGFYKAGAAHYMLALKLLGASDKS